MDDAALIKVSGEDSIVVASDFIRGSEFYLFKLGYLNYFDIGYYLVIANLSDIAAIGANPIALNTIIRYEKELTDEQFTQILEGIKTAADEFKVRVIGGDIGGHNSNVLAATAIGLVKTESALLRKNVKDSDLLCVTGSVGLPITALIYFKKAKLRGLIFTFEEEEKLLQSWKRPSARVKEGLISEGQFPAALRRKMQR
jgi:thiamine-monophosphate kinase